MYVCVSVTEGERSTSFSLSSARARVCLYTHIALALSLSLLLTRSFWLTHSLSLSLWLTLSLLSYLVADSLADDEVDDNDDAAGNLEEPKNSCSFSRLPLLLSLSSSWQLPMCDDAGSSRCAPCLPPPLRTIRTGRRARKGWVMCLYHAIQRTILCYLLLTEQQQQKE